MHESSWQHIRPEYQVRMRNVTWRVLSTAPDVTVETADGARFSATVSPLRAVQVVLPGDPGWIPEPGHTRMADPFALVADMLGGVRVEE